MLHMQKSQITIQRATPTASGPHVKQVRLSEYQRHWGPAVACFGATDLSPSVPHIEAGRGTLFLVGGLDYAEQVIRIPDLLRDVAIEIAPLNEIGGLKALVGPERETSWLRKARKPGFFS